MGSTTTPGVAQHPILFKPEMVRAILAGRKTQTRRIITRRNSLVDGWPCKVEQWAALRFDEAWTVPGPSPAGDPGPYLKVPWHDEHDEYVSRVYPRVQPGDTLWVKETWREADDEELGICVEYRADGERLKPEWPTPQDGWRFQENVHATDSHKWRPSIFLPKWCSRISLLVDVSRPERVAEISEADAQAEGIDIDQPGADYWSAQAGFEMLGTASMPSAALVGRRIPGSGSTIGTGGRYDQ